MKQEIVANKTEEMQDYMGQVKTLLAKYTPPEPQRMDQPFKAGNASLNPGGSADAVGLVFKDYAQPGDQMTLSFDTASKKLRSIRREHLHGRPERHGDVGRCRWRACLMERTMFSSPFWMRRRRSFEVTTTNSNYQHVGGQ